MPCTKSNRLSGGRPSSCNTVSMIFAVSDLENPRLRKNPSRSSSVRATIRSRAALIPAMNGAGEESAKRVRAGVASWAKRCAANLEWRMVISSKFSTPQRLRFTQTAGLNGVGVVHQKQEHVAVAGVKRDSVLGDVDEGVMRHRLPVEHARDLPPRVAGSIARDVNHGGDKFVIPDAAIVRAGNRAKLDAAVTGFQGLHLLAAMGQQTVLQVDPRQRCGELAQIG